MNELNELEKKIFEAMEGFPYEVAEEKMTENYLELKRINVSAISKFFLEEIKEAWIKGQDALEWHDSTGWKVNQKLDDYLKSKYKI